jgi:hypothetical protein
MKPGEQDLSNCDMKPGEQDLSNCDMQPGEQDQAPGGDSQAGPPAHGQQVTELQVDPVYKRGRG